MAKKEKSKSKKKNKEELEPQYYLSPTHIQTINYKVYYLSVIEKILYFLLAFAVGAVVGYLFYGGIGKNQYGEPTTKTHFFNIVIPSTVGFIAGKMFLPLRQKQILDKRRKQLSSQFRDMLDGITTSLGAGNNVPSSFASVYNDLKIQYEEDAFILKELEIILSGMKSNFSIEELLEDFGNRSGIDDIKSFASVFKISYRKGGNIQEIIKRTHAILSKKMEIKEDIETTVAGSKMDQMILLVMPVALIAIIKTMSPEFAGNFVSGTGLVATTISIVLFAVSYFVGRMIMDIKI